MYVLVTAYDRKLRGRAKDVARATHKGAKLRVYKPPRRNRWEG